MRIAEVDFPQQLIESLTSGNLVVFAGAGVSMGKPANLPSFRQLVKEVATGTSYSLNDDEPLDRFLGRLQSAGTDVHARVREILTQHDTVPTQLHLDILRLFPSLYSTHIVTTNFDLLFEQAANTMDGGSLEAFGAPALPLGRDFRGLVHVHGELDKPTSLVLTDEDFGRAYIVDGYTRRFLVELFQSFDVLFIGYRHDDTIMNYLARALPTDGAGGREGKKRYVLTDDNDVSHWRYLNIDPIPYPNEDETHAEVARAVSGLANLVSRGALEWQERIYSIARGKPIFLNEIEEAELTYALRDDARTRFFTDAATEPEWIDWLDDHGFLDNLFARQGLEGPWLTLGRWMAYSFACTDPDRIMEIIGKHDTQISPLLWLDLARAVARDEDSALTVESLGRWVALLLATMPDPREPGLVQSFLLLMVSKCDQKGEHALTVDIFNALASNRVVPFPQIGLGGATFRPEVLGDHFHLSEIWASHLKPYLNMLAKSLLAKMYARLVERHEEAQIWQPMTGGLDADSTFRPRIEPDDTDRSEQALDVIVDVARDCLVYLARDEPEQAAPWFELFIHSEVPFLRRIAVHALPQRSDLDTDKKAEWLAQEVGMFGLAERHEIHRAIQTVYPHTSQQVRDMIIEAILSYGED